MPPLLLLQSFSYISLISALVIQDLELQPTAKSYTKTSCSRVPQKAKVQDPSSSASIPNNSILPSPSTICANPFPRLLQVAQAATTKPQPPTTPSTPYTPHTTICDHLVPSLPCPYAFPQPSSQRSLHPSEPTVLPHHPTKQSAAPALAPALAPYSHRLHSPCRLKRVSRLGAPIRPTRAPILQFPDHNTPSTTWTRPSPKSVGAYPRAHAPSPTPPAEPILSPNTPNADGTYTDVGLPLGWEESRTPDGCPYFIDHHTRMTTWNDPR